jgi:hypothetical protein
MKGLLLGSFNHDETKKVRVVKFIHVIPLNTNVLARSLSVSR